MDATRVRRTRSTARRIWYAHWRQLRFARFMGVVARTPAGPFGAANPGSRDGKERPGRTP